MPSLASPNKPTRRERERLARRASMLDAARQVFSQKGYGGATLEEIALRAEFGKGTLYNYFPGGKDEILIAVFDELYDDLVGIARDALRLPDRVEAADLRGAFGRFIARCFDYYETREELFLILTKEAYRMSFSEQSDRAEYFISQRERLVDVLRGALDEGRRAGLVRGEDSRSIAQMILGNIHGYQMHRCLLDRRSPGAAPEPPSSSEAARFVTSMLFDGLIVRDLSPNAQ